MSEGNVNILVTATASGAQAAIDATGRSIDKTKEKVKELSQAEIVSRSKIGQSGALIGSQLGLPLEKVQGAMELLHSSGSGALGALAKGGAMVGVAIAGWEIGKKIAEFIELEKHIGNIVFGIEKLTAKSAEQDAQMAALNAKIEARAKAEGRLYDNTSAALAEIRKQQEFNLSADAAKLQLLQKDITAQELIAKAAIHTKQEMEEQVKLQKLKGDYVAIEKKLKDEADAKAEEEKRKAEEEARQQQKVANDFEKGVSKRISDKEEEIKLQKMLNEGKDREAAIEKAIYDAKADAESKGQQLNEEQLAKIAEQAGELYDLQNQGKGHSKSESVGPAAAVTRGSMAAFRLENQTGDPLNSLSETSKEQLAETKKTNDYLYRQLTENQVDDFG